MPPFSPDFMSVLTASADGTARLWSIETQAAFGVLSDDASYASYSPDGSRVATSSSFAETATVWDLASRTPVARLQGHTSGINSVVFSRDGICATSMPMIDDVRSKMDGLRSIFRSAK